MSPSPCVTPLLAAHSNRYPIKAGEPKPVLLLSCRATWCFLLMWMHRPAAANHSSMYGSMARFSNLIVCCDGFSALLCVGVRRWITTPSFPPPVSSSLSTMRLALLFSVLSKGNEASCGGPDEGPDDAGFLSLHYPCCPSQCPDEKSSVSDPRDHPNWRLQLRPWVSALFLPIIAVHARVGFNACGGVCFHLYSFMTFGTFSTKFKNVLSCCRFSCAKLHISGIPAEQSSAETVTVLKSAGLQSDSLFTHNSKWFGNL